MLLELFLLLLLLLLFVLLVWVLFFELVVLLSNAHSRIAGCQTFRDNFSKLFDAAIHEFGIYDCLWFPDAGRV